jgi:hypothetical protein
MKEQLRDAEHEDQTPVYSPTMTDAEIEALIARLDRNREARTHGQPYLTDSVKIVRKMRQERTKELMRRVTNARRS